MLKANCADRSSHDRPELLEDERTLRKSHLIDIEIESEGVGDSFLLLFLVLLDSSKSSTS